MMRFSGEAVSDAEIEVRNYAYQLILIDILIIPNQEIINEADMDHNGLIDYTEFFLLMSPTKR